MSREVGERWNGPYKHGNKWRVVVTRSDGYQVVSSFTSRARAVAEIEEGRARSTGRTLSTVVDAYEVSLRERGLAGGSITRARYHLDRLLVVERNANRPVTWLLGQGESLYQAAQSGVSVATHRNALAAGKAFGAWLLKRKLVRANPFAEVEPVGRPKRGKPQLTLDESRKLVAACLAENKRESVAIAVTLLMGMRATEVAHRQVRDLDDGGRLLWITHGKTHAAKRPLEVPDVLRPHLLALAAGRAGASYLFGEADVGPPPSRYWMHYHCARLCKVARVPEVPPHGLRGTHATLARGAGISAHVVAAQLGHTSASMTESAYIAPGESRRADARAAASAITAGNACTGTRYQGSSGGHSK